VGILRPSCSGFSASIEFTGCTEAEAQRKLASRKTGHSREEAAYLAALNLEGREMLEGGICTLYDTRLRSQDPPERQERFSMKKSCFGRVFPGRVVCSLSLDQMAAANAAVTRPYRLPLKLNKNGRRLECLGPLHRKQQSVGVHQAVERVQRHLVPNDLVANRHDLI